MSEFPASPEPPQTYPGEPFGPEFGQEFEYPGLSGPGGTGTVGTNWGADELH